jgi:GntR family transcriptional regulator/MocR family aminotransferase
VSSGSRVAELLLEVLPGSGLRLRDQLRDQLVEAVEQGRLLPGERLPPSRQLARDLGVARGTVVDVYGQLVQDGYLTAQVGSGTRVAAIAARPPAEHAPPVPAPMYDLRPGGPDLSAFPRTAWAMATAHVLRTLPDSELGYVEPWGTAALRSQLARYLARTRHVDTAPERIVVTSGVTQALTLTWRVLRDHGHRTIAVEDPSNAIQREVIARYGLSVVNVPVDEEGLDVSALERSGARAALVTPAHQYPTGAVLTPARRAALLAWARAHDRVVVEDDYDAEFPRARGSTRSLQADDPDRVLHTASISKTLAPGVRLGWLVVPPRLTGALLAAKRDDDFGTDVLSQHVLAHLVGSGAYDRHLRRQRLVYTMRRAALVEELGRTLPSWTARGAPAGLHLWLEPPGPVDEEAVIAQARQRDVLVLGMSAMRRHSTHSGLVLGFARLRVQHAPEVAARLAEAVDAAATAADDPRAATTGASGATARTGTTGVDFFP